MALDQVNQLASAGVYNDQSGSLSALPLENTNNPLQNTQNTAGYSEHSEGNSNGSMAKRIWIAPYEDKEGNYHESSYVYTTIKNSNEHSTENVVKSVNES